MLHLQLDSGFVHLEFDEFLLLFLFVSSIPVDLGLQRRHFFGFNSRFPIRRMLKNGFALKTFVLLILLIIKTLLIISSLSRSCFASRLWALDKSDIVNLLKNLFHAHAVHLDHVHRIHWSH
jgi:hypothetical protein